MKATILKGFVLGALLLAASCTTLHAQTYTIGWSKIAGGAGTSVNGPYTFNGTIGQPEASAPASQGQYSFTSGFWSPLGTQTSQSGCITIQSTNVVAYTCDGCATVPFNNAVASDTCCTGLNLNYYLADNTAVQVTSNTCFAVNTTNSILAVAVDSCDNVVSNFFTVVVLPGSSGPAIYKGNSVAVPQLQTGQSFAADSTPPLVILGEYDPAGPLPGSGLELPSGTIKDVKWYGTNANFTLYALAYVGPGAKPNEQVFRVDSSETFSNSIDYQLGTNTLTATNFFVNCGDLLAFSGIGPFYPNYTAEDQLNYDATYGNETNNVVYPLAFTATPPGPDQTFTVGIAEDTNATYDYIPDTEQNQGRYYAIGVDLVECGACTANCLSMTCPGDIVTNACSGPVAISYAVEASDICTNTFTLVSQSPAGTASATGTSGSATLSASGLFNAGTTIVTNTASDGLGNSETITFTVTVLPGNCQSNCMSLNYTNIVATACGSCTTVSFSNLVTDACCPNLSLNFFPSSNTCFDANTTTPVEVVASDSCGNTNVYHVTVTVLSTNQASINCPTNMTVTTGCGSVQVFYDVTATNAVNLTVDPPSGSFFAPGTNTVYATAQNACGSYVASSFTVTVVSSSCVPGETWVEQNTPSGIERITSSSDGSKLAGATYGGPIYTSSDYGVTWIKQNSPDLYWTTIASSSDGIRLWSNGATNGVTGQIYSSVDSGVTWTKQQNSPYVNWVAIASSSNGSMLVGACNPGYIYTSSNYGTNWTEQNSGSQNWECVASSADGTHLVAAALLNGGIYTSTDSGADWNLVFSLGNSDWFRSVASSADGTKLVAVSGASGVYTSVNSGATWAAQNNSPSGLSVASSSDGSKLLLSGFNTTVYISSNYGTNWSAEMLTTNSASEDVLVVSSSDGSKLAALSLAGPIYTSDCFSSPCCVPPPDNMVLWLPFDETGGDLSANLASEANYGTQINNPKPLLGAYVDNSLLFNGNNYVTVPDYPAIEIGTNDLTIDVWIDITNASYLWSTNVILEKHVSNGAGYSLYSIQNYQNNLGGSALLLVMSGSLYFYDINLSTNQWHFVAASVSRSTGLGYFYVDGVPGGGFTPTSVSLYNSIPLNIGGPSDVAGAFSAQGWQGALDEVEVYDRALATNELAAIYNAGTAGKCKPCCYLNNLSIAFVSKTSVEVNWGGCGVLEASTNLLSGQWTPIQNAASPYIVTATNQDTFYRLQCPETSP